MLNTISDVYEKYNNYCKVCFIVLFSILMAMVVFSQNVNASTQKQVEIHYLSEYGKPSDKYIRKEDVVISGDEILVDPDIILSNLELDGSDFCYDDCKVEKLATKNGDSLTFTAGSDRLIRVVNGAAKYEYLPAGSIPISTAITATNKTGMLVPMNYIYERIGGNTTFIYDSQSGIIWTNLYKNQKAFLSDFKYRLKACTGDYLDWDSHDIIYEDNGKFGLVDYFSDDKSAFANRTYHKYKITVKPEYDEIYCKNTSSQLLILKKGTSIRFYNLNNRMLSDEYDSMSSEIKRGPFLDDLEVDSLPRPLSTSGVGYGGIGEFYVVMKNGKHGFVNNFIYTNVIYDRIEERSGSEMIGDVIESYSYVFLYKGDEKYVVVGDKVINYAKANSTDEKLSVKGGVVALLFAGLGVVVVLAIIAATVINKKRQRAAKTKDEITRLNNN